MSFMKLFTERGLWYVVDGDCGGAVIPLDPTGCRVGTGHVFERGKDGAFPALERALLPFYEGSRLESVELVRGWCARYSAPGYMDRTDWCGPYATEEEAVEECRSMYGEDEDDEDEDEEETAP